MGWTRQDEQRRVTLANELRDLNNKRAEAVDTLTKVLGLAGMGSVAVSNAIDHADALRDALAPFDSGVREA